MLGFVEIELAGRPYILNLSSISRLTQPEDASDRLRVGFSYAIHFIGENEPLFISGEDFLKIRMAVAKFSGESSGSG